MRLLIRSALAAALVSAAAFPTAARPTAAQQGATAPQPLSLTADLLRDVSQVEQKVVALARAMPADKLDWRPGQGVRSVGEVFLHVAADNYLLASILGFPADAATGIKADDYRSASAFEQRKLAKDAIVAELEKSFAHLKKGLAGTPASRLGDRVSLFGQPHTVQQTWIMTATHMHEHLGQLIAYARTNGVKPPWS